MLAVSDNDATNILAAFVGLEKVNELAAELGLARHAHAAPHDGHAGGSRGT